MIKIIMIIAITLVTNSRTFGQNSDPSLCANATTTAETEACLKKEYNSTEIKLRVLSNKISNKFIKTNRGNCAIAFKKAQLNWEKYRDSYANVWVNLYSGGSVANIVFLQCKINTTNYRITELRILLDELNK